MEINFTDKKWENLFFYAKSYRFDQDVKFSQKENYITNNINPDFPDGFEYINIFTKAKYSYTNKISTVMSFEEYGAPMITFCNSFDIDSLGNYRMNNYYEIVLYEDGINIWYLYLEDNKCKWTKLGSFKFKVTNKDKHLLETTVFKDQLVISVDNVEYSLKISDVIHFEPYTKSKYFPEKFHFGVGVCEQINRIYNIIIK